MSTDSSTHWSSASGGHRAGRFEAITSAFEGVRASLPLAFLRPEREDHGAGEWVERQWSDACAEHLGRPGP